MWKIWIGSFISIAENLILILTFGIVRMNWHWKYLKWIMFK